MAAFKDYYDVLGIGRDATEKDVRRAFRTGAAKHHPDRNPNDPGAEERFKEINEAYTVLADAEKRAVYDRYGADGPSAGARAAGGPGGFPGGFASRGTVYSNVSPEEAAGFSDFFRSLFGGGAGPEAGFGDPFGDPYATSRRTVTQGRPRTVEATLAVDLEHAYAGGPVTVSIDDRALEVTIPPGLRDGGKLRLRGQAPGGGNLVLVVRHQPHPRWRLEGDTLTGRVDVPDHVAVLGGHVRVPALDGDVDMRVPAGTSAGRKLRLRGRGWPKPGGGRGDAVAEVRLVVPSQPTDEQRALYEGLRDAADGA